VPELQGHGKSSIPRQFLAIKMHNVLRLPSTGGRPKKTEEKEHGKENPEEGQEAGSHQTVDDFRQGKRQVPAVNFLLTEPSGHTKTGENKNMAKKILKPAKKLEATKPLTIALGR
jgi:hypothetical protein